MNKFKKRLRIFFAVILITVVFGLFWLFVAPSGRITYVYSFKKRSDFISKLTPLDRVKSPVEGIQKIIGNPAYFNLRTSRRFEKAKLSLKYKSPESCPIIEAGVLIDDVVWQYDLKPIENKILNNLYLKWNSINKNGLMLFQREKKYGSINEFLDNLPDYQKIALYNYDLKTDFILPNYERKIEKTIIENDLRGDYQFFTYLKNEDLFFDFTFLDLNKNKNEGGDPIEIIIYYQNKQLEKRTLDDDGIINDSGETKNERNVKLELLNMPEGVYKISVKANEDIITKKIESKQKKISFINKLYIFKDNNNTNYPKSLITDSKQIQAKTSDPDRLQTILIKELYSPRSSFADEININETYKQFESKIIESKMAEIIMEKNGIYIAGDGVFSFSEESYINPKFRRVDATFNADKEGIDYVLANYQIPAEKKEWGMASAEFDIGSAYSKDNKYNFIISIPGLKADDNLNDYIELDWIKIELKGKSLIDKIINNKK